MSLSAEQEALVGSVRGVLARHADSADLWRTLADQIGVAALPIPEEYGGAGAGLIESALVLEEVGRALVAVPLLSSLVAARATQDPALLERIAAGEVAAVVFDRGGASVAEPGPVPDAAEASFVLAVSTERTALVEDATVTPVPALDPNLRLGRVQIHRSTPIVGDAGLARQALLVGLSALAVGCAQRGLEMTVSYAKERHQFGRPIGSFQALKHRMADMLVLVETSRSAARAAAAGELAAAAAAAYCTDAAARVAAETIQLHGGIAITWEHDAHLVFKRAHALAQLAGPAHLLRREALGAKVSR